MKTHRKKRPRGRKATQARAGRPKEMSLGTSVYNRSLIEASLDPLVTIGPHGKITDVNAATEAATGRTRAELIGTDFSEYFTEPEKARLGYQQVFRDGLVRDYPLELRHRDGHVTSVLYNASVYRDERGNVIGVFAAARDITARKQAEEALRESQAFYSSLVAQLPAGVFRKDREGRYVFVSPWFCRLKGMKKEEFLGKMPQEVAASEAAKQDPTGRAIKYAFEGADQHVRIMQTGTPIELVEEYTDAAGKKQFVHAIKIPVFNSEGKIIGTQGLLFDITERKQAEEALRESEERFVQFMRNLPAMTFIKDCARRIVFVNERVRQVFGFTAAECLGKVSEDLWPGPIGQQIREEDERVLANGEVMTVVQEIPTRDGLRVFQAIKFPIPRGQQPPLLGDISLDVTEIRRTEEKILRLNAELEQRVRERTAELEVANQELEAFSYSVSHDLRGPLRAMDGFSMALLEDCAGQLDETAQNHLRRIRAGSQRMAELIDDLLNLSREARVEIRRESVDLTAMAEEIGAEFQRAHPDRKVKSVVAPALAADADARMVRVVLNNLLGNAWKFTSRHEQARIEVGAREQDGQHVFFVRDNGAGFDMAYAGRLFGAFQRLHSTQEFEGTGIGLAIVQRIIHRHGGRVWAEGAVGQGATVYFTFGKERD